MAKTNTTTTAAEITVERDEVHVIRRINQQDRVGRELPPEIIICDDPKKMVRTESQKVGGASVP